MRIVLIWAPIPGFADPFDNMYEAFVFEVLRLPAVKWVHKSSGKCGRKTEANFVIEQRTITKVTPSEFHNSGSI